MSKKISEEELAKFKAAIEKMDADAILDVLKNNPDFTVSITSQSGKKADTYLVVASTQENGIEKIHILSKDNIPDGILSPIEIPDDVYNKLEQAALNGQVTSLPEATQSLVSSQNPLLEYYDTPIVEIINNAAIPENIKEILSTIELTGEHSICTPVAPAASKGTPSVELHCQNK